MSYEEILNTSDEYIKMLDSAVESADDEYVKARYVGFLAVTSVTFFEEALKEIIFRFANKKNTVFGNFVQAHYERLNGRISLREIREQHIFRFGARYRERFDRKMEKIEKRSLLEGCGSIKASYGNLLSWRNGFVHGGKLPTNATYPEARACYSRSKEIFKCIDNCLYR